METLNWFFWNHFAWEAWGTVGKNACNVKARLLPVPRMPRMGSVTGERLHAAPLSSALPWPCSEVLCYKVFQWFTAF